MFAPHNASVASRLPAGLIRFGSGRRAGAGPTVKGTKARFRFRESLDFGTVDFVRET